MVTLGIVIFLVAIIGVLLALDLNRSWRDEEER